VGDKHLQGDVEGTPPNSARESEPNRPTPAEKQENKDITAAAVGETTKEEEETPTPTPTQTPPTTPTQKKPPADEVERIKKKLLREINRLDILINNLVDNGLFDKQKEAFEKKGIQPDEAFEEIQQHLKDARTRLYDEDLPGAQYSTTKAQRSYDKALYIPSWRWRFSNVYGAPIWIYLIGFLGAVLAFYAYQLDQNFLKLSGGIQVTALHAATWGTIGGLLRGLWFLKDKVSARQYKNSFRIYFLSVPFLGGLFGAMVYLVLVAGLFVLAPTQAPAILNQTASGPNATQTNITTNETQANTTSPAAGTSNETQANTPPATTTTTNITSNVTRVTPAPAGDVSSVAIIPLAALAGYNWEWAVMIFNRIGDSFKERREEKEEEKEE